MWLGGLKEKRCMLAKCHGVHLYSQIFGRVKKDYLSWAFQAILDNTAIHLPRKPLMMNVCRDLLFLK